MEEATPGRPQHRRLVSGYISGNAELLKEASAVSIDLGSKVLFRTIQITGGAIWHYNCLRDGMLTIKARSFSDVIGGKKSSWGKSSGTHKEGGLGTVRAIHI